MTWGRRTDPYPGKRIAYSSMMGQEIDMGLEILMILYKVS